MRISTAQAHKVWVPRAGASNDRALVVVSCAFPRAMVTCRRETSCFRALGEPRRADFVAGAALCEPRRVDFVTGTALCEP